MTREGSNTTAENSEDVESERDLPEANLNIEIIKQTSTGGNKIKIPLNLLSNKDSEKKTPNDNVH